MNEERIFLVAIESGSRSFLKRNRWLLLRRSCQLGLLLLFLAGPYWGVWLLEGNLASSRILGTVALTDPLIALQSFLAGHQIYATAVIGALTVTGCYLLIGGRAYCSWVCPINLVTDFAHWLRRRLGVSRDWKIPKSTRYLLLVLVLLLSFLTHTILWEFVNPITLLHRGLVFGLGLSWTVVLIIFFLDLFVSQRGWCGALCPVGAFYGLLGAKSLLRINAKARETCTDCGYCYRVCPEPQVIVPVLKGEGGPVILSGECTNCGRCVDVCDEQVLDFSHRFVR